MLAAFGLGLLGERGRNTSPAIVPGSSTANGTSTGFREDRPNQGTDNLLSPNQLHYCLAEAIRLEGMRLAVGSDNSQINAYNAAVADSNSRCGSYRYDESALQAARSRVERVRADLMIEGRSRLSAGHTALAATEGAPSKANVAPRTADATAPTFTLIPQAGFIIVNSANLRERPDERSAVIAKLPAMTAVSVLDFPELHWYSVTAVVESQELTGFVSSHLVAMGDRRSALGQYCSPAGPERPVTGSVIQQARRGDHQLRVKAANSDVLVKLKTAAGSTALAFYVRAHESGQVTSLGDGDYYVYFATGSNFSTKCMEFLDNMSVQKDASLASFQTSVRGDYIYHSSAEYQLTTQSGGNFRPSHATADEFRN